jgi:SAM-dependent MidA family methyltransferase
MNLLKQKIIEEIARNGPVPFDRFMEMALYEPSLGYYASENTEIGKKGDFYTSQHVHSIFGMMIGRQFEEMRDIIGKPDVFYIIEPGAGAAYLCRDVLDYLNSRKLIDHFLYIIQENNEHVKKRQQNLLNVYSDKVRWVSSLDEIGNVKGCVFSNELLDAFPVKIIEQTDTLQEVYVTYEADEIKENLDELSTEEIVDYFNDFGITLPYKYRTEVNLRISDWLRAVSALLSEGFVFTIDYGYPAWDYYSEERNRGTLLCYHKHQYNENPYQFVGEQDITAHVNFSSVRKWGDERGFKTIGFCQQGVYLVSLGIDEMIQTFPQDSKEYLFEIAKIKKLILPGTIGETHKVMIQYKGDSRPELRGFSIKNQKDKL